MLDTENIYLAIDNISRVEKILKTNKLTPPLNGASTLHIVLGDNLLVRFIITANTKTYILNHNLLLLTLESIRQRNKESLVNVIIPITNKPEEISFTGKLSLYGRKKFINIFKLVLSTTDNAFYICDNEMSTLYPWEGNHHKFKEPIELKYPKRI